MCLSPLWQCVVLLLSFISIIFVIGHPTNRKQVWEPSMKKKCRIYHLSYDLVIKCCFHNGQHPSQLYGYTLSPPIYKNNKRRRRIISQAKSKVKYNLWNITVVYHEFFFIHDSDSSYSLNLDSGMHSKTLSWFRDSLIKFQSVM